MTSNLKQLLSDYESKRNIAILNAENKKKKVYDSNPELYDIDNSISKLSLKKSKMLLQSDDKSKILSIDSNIKKLKKKKESILSNIGLSMTDFNPIYSCKLCNDTGYITENYKTSMCTCLKQQLFDREFNTYNVYSMKNQTFDKFDITVYSNKANKEKYNSEISPKKNIQIIKDISKKFIENFDDSTEKNLLFTGNSGLGKTFLSNCIANELLKKNKTVLYQTAPVMLDNIISYKLRKK